MIKKLKKIVKQKIITYNVYSNELKSSKVTKDNLSTALCGEMLVLAHGLEKGMGLKNSRKGYGKGKARMLIDVMLSYYRKYDVNTFAYNESLAILKCYFDLMKVQGESITDLLDAAEPLFISSDFNDYSVGFKDINMADVMRNSKFDVNYFFSSRHSIRSYSKEEISKDELEKAIELANMAPSACNRQPVHLYFTSTQSKALQFEKMIGGSIGFEGEVPYYICVTVDRLYFSTEESLQWYVNGGIYLSYLVLALHSQGIGSIILQWRFGTELEDIAKLFLGISASEAIVALVGCGKYLDGDCRCIEAQRKPVSDTLTIC